MVTLLVVGGPFPPLTQLRTGPAQIDTSPPETRLQAKAPTLTTSSSVPPSDLGYPACRLSPVRPVDDARSVTSGDGLRHGYHRRRPSARGTIGCLCLSVLRQLRPAATQAAWPPGRR